MAATRSTPQVAAYAKALIWSMRSIIRNSGWQGADYVSSTDTAGLYTINSQATERDYGLVTPVSLPVTRLFRTLRRFSRITEALT